MHCLWRVSGTESHERALLGWHRVAPKFGAGSTYEGSPRACRAWPLASLRWGELAALRRGHVDLASGTLRVALSVVELVDGSLVTGPPKSEAGKRIVTLPPFLLPEIKTHPEQFTAPDDDSLVFVGPKNGPL